MAVSDAVSASAASREETARARAVRFLTTRHRLRWSEALPWLAAIGAYFLFPDRLTFGSQVLLMAMFALSLDLILGYAGIVTLGHAAFFGLGAYTVGVLAAHLNWGEPISGLLAGALVDFLCQIGEARLNDAARMAWDCFENHGQVLLGALEVSQGGAILRRLGYDEDIRAAAQVDQFALVPELRRDPLRVEVGAVGIAQSHWPG